MVGRSQFLEGCYCFSAESDNGYGSMVPIPFTTITEPSACLFQVFTLANYLVEFNLHFHAWPSSLSISQTLAILLVNLVSPYHLLRFIFLSFYLPFPLP